jgi:hypothetical protein
MELFNVSPLKQFLKNHPFILAVICALIVFAPAIGGLFAKNVWFVPSSETLLWAKVLGFGYWFVLSLAIALRQPHRFKARSGKLPNWLAMLIVVCLFGYLTYGFLATVVPAVLTDWLGRPTVKEMRVLALYKNPATKNRSFCPYLLRLEGVNRSIDDGLCFSENDRGFWPQKNESVLISGLSSSLGLRIKSITQQTSPAH